MKTIKVATAFLTILTLVSLSVLPLAVSAQTSQEQNQATAIMRGYRTGYSDGYQEGVADVGKNASREFRNKSEYDKADRAFNPAWGSVEDYRDGYRQGYEAGYNAAYDHKGFDSSIPPDLTRKTEDSTVQYPIDANKQPGDPNKSSGEPNKQSGDANKQSSDPSTQTTSQTTTQTDNTDPNGPAVLPRDTILRVELMNNLATESSQKGDRFQARVIEPGPYQGAILDGHLQQVKRPGKAKGTAELQLAFDKITLNNRSAKLVAQVIEVIKNGADQGIGKVDSEGGVNGSDSTKSDVKKVGIATGIGAALGAIFGGGVGAAVGATMGAGVGTAGVLTQRGKDIHLDQGQHLRIRTNADAEIQ
jgi:flagellar biosynthesis/type III secretory pathway protein FliH